MAYTNYKDIILVVCEALRPEIERLREAGEIDFKDVLYVHPGSHERPRILEEQLPDRLAQAAESGSRVVVALGTKCYFDLDNPERNIDALIAASPAKARRVQAEDCVDMLADTGQRSEIAQDRSIYWMTPGWVLEREKIFEGWDHGKANETFPRHDAVVLLDALNFFEDLSMENPEELLDFSDWLGVGLEPAPVNLDRLLRLLKKAAEEN